MEWHTECGTQPGERENPSSRYAKIRGGKISYEKSVSTWRKMTERTISALPPSHIADGSSIVAEMAPAIGAQKN